MNAMLYLTKAGCQWRMIPKDFLPHQTVWSFYRRAKKSGLWTRLMKVLVKLDHEMREKKADPSFSLGPAEERGFDEKKDKGQRATHRDGSIKKYICCACSRGKSP
jgi:transposase